MKKLNGKFFKTMAILFYLLGIVYICINVFSFKATIDYYVDYGYTASEVIKEMWLNTLMPVIIEPLINAGGIGTVLLGISKILEEISSSENDILNNTDIETQKEENQEDK